MSTQPSSDETDSALSPQPSARKIGPQFSALAKGIALAALLVALGNIASRVLGLARNSTVAYLFGRASVDVNAYSVAWLIPNTLYDFLINGAISAALVPVFSAYAEGDDDEFWRVACGVINLAMLVLVALTALLALAAPFVVQLVTQDTEPGLRAQTLVLVRLMLLAVPLMGLSGLLTALLYARRRFLLPAFVASAFNAGIIAGALLLHRQLGIESLAAGMLLGALVQVLIQLPGLRGGRYRLALNWRHPGVRRVLALYGPVALGMGFSIIGAVIDRRLASGFAGAPATMSYATTLIQFPLGLVAAAVSTAVLPTLSRQSVANDEENFRATFALGLKVVLLLVVPATAALAVLRGPVVALLFEGGQFSADDSQKTALALLCYLPGLPAAAVDQMLLFAFYARRNTLTPNLVQGAAIGIYLLTALPLVFATRLGFLALVLGNAAQWIGHAVLLWLLLRRAVPLGGLRLGEASAKIVLASGVMALALGGMLALLPRVGLALQGRFYGGVVPVLLGGVLGALVYFGACAVLRVEALGFFVGAVRGRLRRR
ncbi:MAG: murein biosynthesis integral membrane protein MurJ [Chloroflexales bacterium]|nr:murein biosynthesis integral membrane protein MurJ [Chloroflexales bacterium]